MPNHAPTAPPHLPSSVEQEHIKQALEASQTAMDSIGTVTDIASYTLTILGVFIAILALWGVVMIIKAARGAAKQIANSRLDAYIASNEFRDLMVARVDASIKAERQDLLLKRLEEVVRGADDPTPFPTKEGV